MVIMYHIKLDIQIWRWESPVHPWWMTSNIYAKYGNYHMVLYWQNDNDRTENHFCVDTSVADASVAKLLKIIQGTVPTIQLDKQ